MVTEALYEKWLFWCLLDDVNGVVELKRRFVLPEYQGNSYGKRDTTFKREKKLIS